MNFLNPLTFPEILGTIFQFLDIQELLKCRKVCKLWNLETSQFIGERKLICINDATKLGQLYDLINRNATQPFRAFELWSFPIDLDNEQVMKYVSTCGPYFHHLTLNFEKESKNLLNIRTLRDLLLYDLPNLKSLSIRQLPSIILAQKWIFPPEGELKFIQPLLWNLQTLTLYSDEEFNFNFISNLFRAMVHLKRIFVEYGDEPKDFKKTILAAIFSCSAHLRELESLQYFLHNPGSGSQNWAWTPEECLKLVGCGFLLKSIKLHPTGKLETRTMFNLLEKLQTLTTLKLRVHDQLRCPIMASLTSVILYDYEGSLVFMDNLPNLRHLGLCEYSPAKFLTPENIVSNNQHLGLLSLNFYGSYAVSNHLFRAIAKTFPQLRILNFWYINNEKLRTVIENFPFLEELTINVVCVDDDALTGFPLELCEQMERMGNYHQIMQQAHTFPRTQPFIGDLANLRRLEMHAACLADWKWSNFSDVSVYFGLMQLTNLTSLSLYEFKWITETAIFQLCKTLPLIYLKLDSRMFPETLISGIKEIRPDIRLETVTDEFESYNTFYVCMR